MLGLFASTYGFPPTPTHFAKPVKLLIGIPIQHMQKGSPGMAKDRQKKPNPVALAQVSHIVCQCHPGGLMSALQMLPHITSNTEKDPKTCTSSLRLFFILNISKEPFPYEIRDKIQTDCASCSLCSFPILSPLVLLLPPSLYLFSLLRSNSPRPRNKYSFSSFNGIDLILSVLFLELPKFAMIPLNSLSQLLPRLNKFSVS